MSFPKTRKEWWALLKRHDDELRDLIRKHHPCSADLDRTHHVYEITAPNAEAVCEIIREEIRKGVYDENCIAPLAMFEQALSAEAGDVMVKVLNETWYGMPESMEVRSEPGFHTLCDLLSESHCVLSEGVDLNDAEPSAEDLL